jgi:hypothetical protein
VTLDLVDGIPLFVGSRRATLEAILPALAPAPPGMPAATASNNSARTSSLAAPLEAATCPSASKVVTVEEKWPHSYGRLLLLTGTANVDALPNFWHKYAGQKKAHCWAYVQAVATAMAGSLGVEAPTIVAKAVKVLDSLVLTGPARMDSLSKDLTVWQFPALAPSDTDLVNESLRSWESLLTGNTAVFLADIKEILQVGKVGAPQSWLHACAQLEHWTAMMALLLGAAHQLVAWVLSLTRLSWVKALVFDC